MAPQKQNFGHFQNAPQPPLRLQSLLEQVANLQASLESQELRRLRLASMVRGLKQSVLRIESVSPQNAPQLSPSNRQLLKRRLKQLCAA